MRPLTDLPQELQEVVEKLGVGILFLSDYNPSEEKIRNAAQALVQGKWCEKPPKKWIVAENLLVFIFEGDEGFDNVNFGAACRQGAIQARMRMGGMHVNLWPAILTDLNFKLD